MRLIQVSRKYERLKFLITHDVGCPDFVAAAANRYRIATGYATEWWKRMESARDSTPANKRLPNWVPQEREEK